MCSRREIQTFSVRYEDKSFGLLDRTYRSLQPDTVLSTAARKFTSGSDQWPPSSAVVYPQHLEFRTGSCIHFQTNKKKLNPRKTSSLNLLKAAKLNGKNGEGMNSICLIRCAFRCLVVFGLPLPLKQAPFFLICPKSGSEDPFSKTYKAWPHGRRFRPKHFPVKMDRIENKCCAKT